MQEVVVSVKYNDKVYQTNVIADKKMSEKSIRQLATEQVIKQWTTVS